MRRVSFWLFSAAALAGCEPEVRRLVPLPGVVPHRDLTDRSAVTILVFGDGGTGSAEQYRVGESMVRVCDAVGCDFGVVVGDNIYPDGIFHTSDPQLYDKFEAPYAGLDLELWLVLGNHDWRSNAQAQIDYTLVSDRWRMPDMFYGVRGLPEWLHIFGWDSQATVQHADAIELEQSRAALDVLCADGWRMIFSHHASLSGGKHGDDPVMQEAIAAVDGTCPIDVVLSGHDHHLELIAGPRYWQVVSGAASQPRPVERVAQSLFARGSTGFAVLDVTASALAVSFYDGDGERLFTHSRDR